jgi:hypothetical protein
LGAADGRMRQKTKTAAETLRMVWINSKLKLSRYAGHRNWGSVRMCYLRMNPAAFMSFRAC